MEKHWVQLGKRHPKFLNFGEYLYWSYANFTMAMAAASLEKKKYDMQCFMIRSKMFKSYKLGTAKVKSLYNNNLWKINDNPHCWYCGKKASDNLKLTVDHVFPRAKGGEDDTDNIIMTCASCNSSKGKKDLMQWFYEKERFPSPAVISTYLKLVLKYSKEHDLMDKTIEELDEETLPFNLHFFPMQFPNPEEWGYQLESES